ncbi:helix-turn-helix domain-containing protein [Actinocrinis puniceicyclus]|uniref:Helix-turn-helix domain-containing protein n=1 Tax=Actinocrinis puniceicyclus TaxID=977794 RepID=A0A8J8B9K0_9ACTN|nr:ArsR family transcriptional regulator [Actinocrinis puniceicyclus]MBS2961912.1 helix-turn-helix domain-containing protein [Actinocrinis puniceicyclus]
MDTELSSLQARARRHAALGESARLAIVERLLLSDASPTELARELGLASNLLAHHLALLEQAGLITRARSEADHRRTYVRLNHAALADLVPMGARRAARVVFVCTANSARSPLAAALWARRSRLPTASAGTEPAPCVHPGTVAAARRHGLNLQGKGTRHLNQVLRADDLVVAVCDRAHEHAAHTGQWLHWAVPDPARDGTDAAFDAAVRELSGRIDRLVPAVHPVTVDHPATPDQVVGAATL